MHYRVSRKSNRRIAPGELFLIDFGGQYEDGTTDILERSPFGNQASIFTSSGAAARRFRYEAPAGNIGINIGVAAPMAYFPFTGWKDSFFGAIFTDRAAIRWSFIRTKKW